MQTTFTIRQERVQAAMRARDFSALLLTPGASMRYLSGFSEAGYERLLALIVPAEGELAFVTPTLNAAQVRDNPAGVANVVTWDDHAGWRDTLTRAMRDLGGDTGLIGVDEGMPARFALPLAELLPDGVIQLAGDVIGALRAVKDADEIAAMRRAGAATDALIPAALAACAPGRSEREIALAIQSAQASAGHEESFETIVGVGANSALPHHHTGAASVRRGDVVLLDFGARVAGYHGDITRTVAVGAVSDEVRRIYDLVYRAQRAAVDAVRPGVTAGAVDAAARQVITQGGHGDHFVHRTGHGIGLEDHESPNIVADSVQVLQPGHCFSIEPGIYLPGQFGVRLENIVAVGEDGRAIELNEPIPAEILVL